MKKIYLAIVLLLASAFYSSNTNAQTITNIQLIDSCANVQLFATIGPASANLTLTTFWGDGSSSSVNLQNTQTTVLTGHNYTASGTYTVKSYLLLNGNAIDSFTNTYANFCSYINIRSYLDNNTNCVRNTTDPYFGSPIDLEVDSAGVIVDTITLYGAYYYKAKSGTVYKFKALNSPIGTTSTCPASGIITITDPPFQSSTNIEFGFQCGSTSQFDLGVSMIGQFRPVSTSRLIIHAFNNACGTKNGVVTVNLDSRYTYKNASPTPTSVTGNTITWNVSNLSLTNRQTIYLYADTATRVTLNDTICNTATITPISGDVNPTNNTLYQCDEVRASWDPNDKAVNPAGDIMPGTKLTYTINFENLGNDTAFNIAILDTLSNNLDVSTFKIGTSSHAVSSAFLDGPGGQKVLRFDFVNILLADKTAPDYNKGFVQFSINARAGLTPLTQINNRAGIYFDINPVVLTNYAENRIAPVGIGNISIDTKISIYPNPVTDILTIKTEQNDFETIVLMNSMGQTVASQQVTDNTSYINMKHLPAGLYYIQLTGSKGTSTQKVEKL